MNVTCTACQTIFRVDPAKVPASGVRARCSVCSGVFWVRHPATAPAPVEVVESVPLVEPAGPPVAAAAPPLPVVPLVPPAVPRLSIPVQAPPTVAPTPALAAAVVPLPTVAPWPASGPAVAPPARRPVPESPPAPPSFERPVERPALLPMALSPSGRPAPPAAPSLPAYVSVAAGTPAPSTAVSAPKKARANPFLSQDPAAKARRLARALISDMVVYHPAKRREGLQNASLKRLFDEEIRKSWEEYVDQVGQDMAQSTPYFQEALNEILADGQSVFP